ncbi:MAG: hypothetical protein HUU45_07020, partial [Leptospiraceae bacterium]|nr:hypothetical protein [Leptospiraceae bacterium]
MSVCQPKNSCFSCGACCGFLNLKISKTELRNLFKKRTQNFRSLIDFKKAHTIAAYRQTMEEKENKIEKFDNTTYNCPFLGYIDQEEKKIGCMIHPVFTKDPKSQNFSFYGASICQGYNCKNKERKTVDYWEDFLSNENLNSIDYSLIISDHITIELLENFFKTLQIPILVVFQNYTDLLKKIFSHRLNLSQKPELLYTTS